ncbi:MAG TPA: permease-like cell division protein FtsX [Chitinophagales bacterium]|nr:permease-like cell division protein FtsX [Chitinophagales bacterium]
MSSNSLRRKSTHYMNAILVTGLALFLLGLIGISYLSFKQEETRLKERIRISAFLNDDAKTGDVELLQRKLESEPMVKSTEFISKERAAEIVREKFEEDISDFLGEYNPLPASVEIYLQADMVNADTIRVFREKLETYPEVNFTKVDEQLVSSVTTGFRTAGYVMAGLCILFVVISVLIIDKTIRLSMYSNRFIIRSMQLVGATRRFITGPYVKRSVVNGILAAVLALAVLGAAVWFIHHKYGYWDMQDKMLTSGFGILALILTGIGILITWWSTRRAVHKYVRMKLDDLY